MNISSQHRYLQPVWISAASSALWDWEKAHNPETSLSGGRTGTQQPASLCITPGKKIGQLSTPDTALQDQEKAHNPETSPAGNRERSNVGTHTQKRSERFPESLTGLIRKGLSLPNVQRLKEVAAASNVQTGM